MREKPARGWGGAVASTHVPRAGPTGPAQSQHRAERQAMGQARRRGGGDAPRTAGRREGAESPLWGASLGHISPQHHRFGHTCTHSRPFRSGQPGLPSVSLEADRSAPMRTVQCTSPTPPAPGHSQAYLLSWWPLRPLGSLHPGKPDDTLQAREAPFALWRSSSRSERRRVG